MSSIILLDFDFKKLQNLTMAGNDSISDSAINFATKPTDYKHWQLRIDGPKATLVMSVDDDNPLRDGYELKLNSYDLSVDIELADAIQRIRFEHPEVKVVTFCAELDKVFCSGANIYMLGLSTHSFKVNFCKFTNETRLYIEEASKNSDITFLAACKGTTAGGGYELALACDEIYLVDDGSSAVSFPETPLLAVLPGTGGLTRLVDKRKVRRDRADVFCTLAEGVKGKRAKEWNLVDGVFPRSKFDDALIERTDAIVADSSERLVSPAIQLPTLTPTIEDGNYSYEYVTLEVNQDDRVATLTVRAPKEAPPTDLETIHSQGASWWAIQAFRELDDALLRLRFNETQCGMVLLKTVGNPDYVLAADATVDNYRTKSRFVSEVAHLQARVLRRLDNTAKSFFAVIDSPESCFAGSLLEIALSADRVYMLEDEDEKIGIVVGPASKRLPMANGLTRLESRFYADASQVEKVLASTGKISTVDAEAIGVATIALDDIDFEDELRIAIEERASLSPDALTGMEASLRFAGPETMETKIFGRLSAWQNWIFTRANATGKTGALTLYGRPERPNFHWNRT